MTERSPTEVWRGEFGDAWTDRNALSVEELDERSIEKYGVSKSQIIAELLSKVDKGARILDVGTNEGVHLRLLQQLGFNNLYGVDIQDYALQRARQKSQNIEFVRGDAMELPFRDESFEIIFTTGVLIHIPPDKIEAAVRELNRCASEYVWGIEYYAEEYTEINYRGHDSLLWKANFAEEYRRNTELELKSERILQYQNESENRDVAFLLSK